jgi:hypothetical protein
MTKSFPLVLPINLPSKWLFSGRHKWTQPDPNILSVISHSAGHANFFQPERSIFLQFRLFAYVNKHKTATRQTLRLHFGMPTRLLCFEFSVALRNEAAQQKCVVSETFSLKTVLFSMTKRRNANL